MREDYIRAKKLGDREVRKAVLAGDYPYLPALDDIVPGIESLAQIPVGLVEIPIDQIAGTKNHGRTNAFARNFMPILAQESEFGVKWSNLYDAAVTEGIRDPIKVYEYMWSFYVEEGNKRVSVSKYTDVTEILGDVTRVMPKYSEDPEVRIYYEFTDFYRVAPLYEIRFSQIGSYQRLAAMVGQDLVHPWPDDVFENVRSSYREFAAAYHKKGGGRINMTCGDAYLTYLQIYGMDSLTSDPGKVIDTRISRIWNEFLVRSRSDNIALATSPAENEKERTIEETEDGTGRVAKDTLNIEQTHGLMSILLGSEDAYTREHPLRVAFLYDKSPAESSWVYGHELGRNHLEEVYEGIVETLRFDGCTTDERTRDALDVAMADEEGLVITTSPAMMNETLRCAVEHPKTKFLNCSINLSHSAVRTYYIRMYEAKFLMGGLAATQAENHRIGYLANSPLYGTIADINAFAIGAAMIDPEVKIYLSWDSEKDTDWKADMRDAGVSVFSGRDLIRPDSASREYGVYRTGDDGEIINLASPVRNWGIYYERLVRTILEGTWDKAAPASKDQALNYWWGMSAGVVDIIVSEKLPYYSKKMLAILKNALLTETFNPFDGELRSQEALIKGADSPALSNKEIISMDWLNDNVIGRIPSIGELTDLMKKTAEVSGVKKDS